MQKKIPMRLCTGCGERKPKNELIRIVRSTDGNIFVDLSGKANGRGAYICKSANCLKAAAKKKRFENAFSCAVSDEVYAALEKELSGLE